MKALQNLHNPKNSQYPVGGNQIAIMATTASVNS